MTAPPLVGASLSQRLMAQRESITAITLVICQSCWAVEERISCSQAPSIFILLLLLSPSRPPLSANGRLKVVTCPFSSRHQASVEDRREMAPIPDTPQKPQSHPIIREAQAPIGEVEKDTLRLGSIVPLHCSVWQYFTICNLGWKHCSSGSSVIITCSLSQDTRLISLLRGRKKHSAGLCITVHFTCILLERIRITMGYICSANIK